MGCDIIILVVLVDIIDNISLIFSLFIIIAGIIVAIITIFSMKRRITKIDKTDYEKVKFFYQKSLKKISIAEELECYAATDYLNTIDELCKGFISGRRNLYEPCDDIMNDLKDSAIVKEMKIAKLDYLKENIIEILNIIYKYYDNNGVWKG